MKILFVSAVLPYPLYSGGQVRIYNLVKRLSQKHEITLFAFIRDEKEKQYLKEFSFCKKIVTVMRGGAWQMKYLMKSFTSSYPFLMSTYDNAAMRNSIENELGSGAYDLVHIEPGYVWPSLPRTNLPVVVSEHNIEHEVYAGYVARSVFRVPLWLDIVKLARWEKIIWKNATRVTAVSEGDKKKIAQVTGSGNVHIVQNGVDLVRFPFKPKKGDMSRGFTCLYVGNFSWIENQDAAAYLMGALWPSILKKYPKAILRIVGKNLPDRLRNMAHAPSMSFLEHVEIIQSELQNADIMLAPIRVGGGTKYKLIEAMASGIPVITTTAGASGLAATDGKNIFIADTPIMTLNRIDELFNTTKRLGLITAARTHVETYFSWEQIARELDHVWKEAHAERH